jgi:8-oxo-dGTP pyrophosphatase MutT (NUDIX family)
MRARGYQVVVLRRPLPRRPGEPRVDGQAVTLQYAPMRPPDLDLIRARLAARRAGTVDALGDRPLVRAAVAAVLRPGLDPELGPEILLIRRAEHPDDPWSGHMAFPGGRAEPRDPDLVHTAIRETEEETGLLLSGDQLLGPLDEVAALARARHTGLVVSPFVFAASGTTALLPNHEVAEIVWAPLGPLMRGEVPATVEYPLDGQTLRLPGFQVGERVVWGLTYGLLKGFFELLR